MGGAKHLAEETHDLAIIGAGCAGLSLAARLAEISPHLKIVLIDPRQTFEDDRTWCFWSAGNTPVEHLIDKRWQSWRFSNAEGRAITHHAELSQYACVRAERVYKSTLLRIENAGFQLRLGETVRELALDADCVRLLVGEDRVLARNVVDTRTPQHIKAKLFQVFSGVEVETEIDRFELGQAGLMEDMGCDEYGFHFTYTLPFSSRRALIEFTRFSPIAMSATSLDSQLQALLTQRGLNRARILRREHGVLPMGQVIEPPSKDPRWVRAGAGAGALRSATGYAFLRIQNWAETCAASLARGGPPQAQQAEPPLRAWLDAVFLSALTKQPTSAADYFLRMARALTPDAFARFMSDAARSRDLAHLMTELPPMPFLSAAARVGLKGFA